MHLYCYYAHVLTFVILFNMNSFCHAEITLCNDIWTSRPCQTSEKKPKKITISPNSLLHSSEQEAFSNINQGLKAQLSESEKKKRSHQHLLDSLLMLSHSLRDGSNRKNVFNNRTNSLVSDLELEEVKVICSEDSLPSQKICRKKLITLEKKLSDFSITISKNEIARKKLELEIIKEKNRHKRIKIEEKKYFKKKE
jgi:hypothetical protein